MNSKDVEVEGNSQKSNQNSESDHLPHLALDLGGSLIKLVYFSRKSDGVDDDKEDKSANEGTRLPGRLHFTKFKYTEINDCFDFIKSKMLDLRNADSQHHKTPTSDKIIIKATGGGSFKYSRIFQEKLGICIEQVDEMDSIVDGVTFLLKTVHQEAFTYMNGQKEYVQIDDTDLYPFMIASLGTGFTITKVDAKGECEPVGGTDIGGGTFWGLGKLITKCKSFDELVELSKRGDNKAVDILIGDMNGGRDYTQPDSGFTVLSTIVASSFGRAMYDNRELEDYKPEDIALSLLRMISNHIGQYACMNALRFGHKRIVFSGSFIRSHASMDVISNSINFWSGGSIQALFLGHQGFIGAIGTFLKYRNYGSNGLVVHNKIMDSSQQNGDLSDEQSIECSIYV